MTKATAIAQILYDAGVRLDDESDLLAMAKADQVTRYTIVTKYRELCGQDVEVTLNFSELSNHCHDVFAWIYETTYEEIKGHLSDDVDSCLWVLQCADRAEGWADDAVRRMKDRGVVCVERML